jgi:hypothetical protein
MTLPELAAEVHGGVNALMGHYPFPNPALHLRSIEEAQAWASEIPLLAEPMLAMMQFRRNDITQFIDASAAATWDEMSAGQSDSVKTALAQQPQRGAEHEQSMKAGWRASTEMLVVDFANNVGEALQVARVTQDRLDRVRRSRSRLPNRSWILASLGAGAVAFLCGVVVPLVWERPSNVLIVVVPIAFYAAVLGSTVLGLSRALGRARA